MGQVRHGSAMTTHAVIAAIQRSQASLSELSRELGINPKTVAKRRKRQTVEDQKAGPRAPRSTVLSEQEEAMIVAFRRHTLLPLDDCLYALHSSIPNLTRSSLHRCLQRHGISRLPDVDGDKPKRQKFKRYPIGSFHIDIAEVPTAEGKLYLFVGIDRTSKFAVTQLVEKADRRTAWEFFQHMLEAVPYQVHTVLTDNQPHPVRRAAAQQEYSLFTADALRHDLRLDALVISQIDFKNTIEQGNYHVVKSMPVPAGIVPRFLKRHSVTLTRSLSIMTVGRADPFSEHIARSFIRRRQTKRRPSHAIGPDFPVRLFQIE